MIVEPNEIRLELTVKSHRTLTLTRHPALAAQPDEGRSVGGQGNCFVICRLINVSTAAMRWPIACRQTSQSRGRATGWRWRAISTLRWAIRPRATSTTCRSSSAGIQSSQRVINAYEHHDEIYDYEFFQPDLGD